MNKHMTSYTHTNQQRKQLRTRELRVNSAHVGIVIGKGGDTIKRLAREAGDGCRIQHERTRPGTFTITARTSQACLRAEIKIKETIQNKTNNKKPRSRPKTNKPSTRSPNNAFSALATDQDTYNPPQQPKKPVTKKPQQIRLGFRDDNSIGKRKYNNWLTRHATDQQKLEHAKKQRRFASPKSSSQSSLTNKDFPSFVKERKTPEVGVWGAGLDKVKAEPVEAEEVEDEGPSDMVVLVKGEVKQPPKFEVDCSHVKMIKPTAEEEYEDPDAFCRDDEDQPEPMEFDDDEDWGEEEDDYHNRFEDEVDHTLISCA